MSKKWGYTCTYCDRPVKLTDGLTWVCTAECYLRWFTSAFYRRITEVQL